jgi:hypothetical protein
MAFGGEPGEALGLPWRWSPPPHHSEAVPYGDEPRNLTWRYVDTSHDVKVRQCIRSEVLVALRTMSFRH